METRSQTLTADNGATVVLGTVVHEGHEYTAGGGMVDCASGHVLAYATGGRTNGHVTLWNGDRIGTWRTVSRWTNATGSMLMVAIEASIFGDARTWYGRFNEDMGEFVHLRPRKSV